MATATATDNLRKGARVTAAVALRDVPEGTAGRVTMVSGLSWIRYWVRFENGVSLGSISRDKLITKEQLEADPDDAAEVVEAADGGAGAGGDDGGAGVATPSGTVVPQKLIDRSAAARVRLGA